MRKREKVERARLAFGIASAMLGLLGYGAESWPILASALFCSVAWLVLCIVSVNLFVDEQIERAAPRKGQHRRNK